jgi:hypothetical protein
MRGLLVCLKKKKKNRVNGVCFFVVPLGKYFKTTTQHIKINAKKKITNLFNDFKNLGEATNFIARLRCDNENVLLTTKNLSKSWDIPTNY